MNYKIKLVVAIAMTIIITTMVSCESTSSYSRRMHNPNLPTLERSKYYPMDKHESSFKATIKHKK
ncbi:MAG: hypothetical protein ACRQFF_01515 [Sphaerochaeta sp.]